MDVKVSITCTTYNHERYIRDALEGFLMQKVDFKYEILIHDDASTDNTANIIREYEKKYPEIFRPIYQSENQYSKGIKVGQLNRIRARGKYIATCEGDDYWTDPYKLQKQVDYMDSHPECSLCVHAAFKVTAEKKRVSKIRPNKGDKVFGVAEIILGGGGLFATNSSMYISEKGIDRPKFFEKAPVGDYPASIFLALQGTVYYMDEFMSAYRVGVDGSWSQRVHKNIDKRAVHINGINNMLDEIDKYSNHKYHEAIERKKAYNEFNLLLAQGKYNEMKEEKFKGVYDNLPIAEKVKIAIKRNSPSFFAHLKSRR